MSENMIKGKIAEAIAEELFRGLGFYVIKSGQEHTVAPLTQLATLVNHYTPVGTPYVVPSGYTFYVTKIVMGTTTAAAIIGYGNDAVADSGTPPTSYLPMTQTFVGSIVPQVDVIIPIPADNTATPLTQLA